MESLIDNHLDMVAKNQIPAIARALHLSSGEAAGYCQIIKSLNPNREYLSAAVTSCAISYRM